MTAPPRAETTLTRVEQAAADAFVFGFPLVLMHRLRGPAPPCGFAHERILPGTAPLPDTLASRAWLDVRDEPAVLSVPEAHGHYYAISLLDMWANVFASIGSRTTGTTAGRFAITAPGVAAPDGTVAVRAPAGGVLLVAQTAVEGGLGSAYALQDRMALGPPGGPAFPAAWSVPLPAAAAVAELETLPAAVFLDELAALLDANPPPRDDAARLVGLRAAGLVPRTAQIPAAALERGVAVARAQIRAAALPGEPAAPGRWRIDYGAIGSRGDHLARAAAAFAGVNLTRAEDEVRASVTEDRRGEPLSGDGHYELRFDADRPPPALGPWSLCAIGPHGRTARLGSRDGLTMDVDGALTIHLRREPPTARDQRSNWLAVPAGGFRLVLRLLWPDREVLARRWSPPGVTRVA